MTRLRELWDGRATYGGWCTMPGTLSAEIVGRASRASFSKLNPIHLLKNPVMFVVEVGAALTTVFLVRDLFTGAGGIGFSVQIALWLWFTVLFANFAEAMAEARGKAQADALRKTKTDVVAKRLTSAGKVEQVPGSMLRVGDKVVIDGIDKLQQGSKVNARMVAGRGQKTS